MTTIHSFTTVHGTRLTYTRTGRGTPVICLPGGPLLPAAYLGDLGGLDRQAELILVNLPGSDGSVTEDKIAALGIRLRRWVSFHGLSLNVEPDLSHFSGIVPCGITGYGVTSLVDLGLPVMMTDVDIRLREAFEQIFGPTVNEREQVTSR